MLNRNGRREKKRQGFLINAELEPKRSSTIAECRKVQRTYHLLPRDHVLAPQDHSRCSDTIFFVLFGTSGPFFPVFKITNFLNTIVGILICDCTLTTLSF